MLQPDVLPGCTSAKRLKGLASLHLLRNAQPTPMAHYLQPLAHDTRFTKIRRGTWTATFGYGGAKVAAAHGMQNPQQLQLLQALSKRGISTMLAIQAIDGYPPEAIVSALKAMDEQRQRGVQIRFADKWLLKALQEGFQPSPEFTSSSLRPERQIFRRK